MLQSTNIINKKGLQEVFEKVVQNSFLKPMTF